MSYCIHIIVAQYKHISHGTAESYLTTRVIQDYNFEIMSFGSREEAEEYLKEGIYDEIWGYDVKGYEIREFVPFGNTPELNISRAASSVGRAPDF
jgi:hypothetical protein